jgi:hypothetical protein
MRQPRLPVRPLQLMLLPMPAHWPGIFLANTITTYTPKPGNLFFNQSFWQLLIYKTAIEYDKQNIVANWQKTFPAANEKYQGRLVANTMERGRLAQQLRLPNGRHLQHCCRLPFYRGLYQPHTAVPCLRKLYLRDPARVPPINGLFNIQFSHKIFGSF